MSLGGVPGGWTPLPLREGGVLDEVGVAAGVEVGGTDQGCDSGIQCGRYIDIRAAEIQKKDDNHFKWLETLKWGRKRLNVWHHLQGREHHLILANDCLLQ